MKSYKNLLLFGLLWFALFFLTEFLIDSIFSDETPFWKLLAVSLISSIAIVYPFLKRGKKFKLSEVKKKQKRVLENFNELDNPNFLQGLAQLLKDDNFKIKKIGKNEISFRSKMSFKTFGERYVLRVNKASVEIESFPAVFMLPFDNGAVFEEMNKIEALIKKGAHF